MSEGEHIGTLYDAFGEWNEAGFFLRLYTDEGYGIVRVRDVKAARSLLVAVTELEGWVREHDRERAAYEARTAAHDAWAREDFDDYFDDGYALNDPKSDGYHDRMSELHDNREGK